MLMPGYAKVKPPRPPTTLNSPEDLLNTRSSRGAGQAASREILREKERTERKMGDRNLPRCRMQGMCWSRGGNDLRPGSEPTASMRKGGTRFRGNALRWGKLSKGIDQRSNFRPEPRETVPYRLKPVSMTAMLQLRSIHGQLNRKNAP